MAIVFTLGRAGLLGPRRLGHTPYMFVLMAALIFFTWGEIFSLFPSTCTDTYGAKYATTNAGLLYTAKGTVGLARAAREPDREYTGSWHTVFVIAAIMNLTVAVLALFVLKPMRRRALSQSATGPCRAGIRLARYHQWRLGTNHRSADAAGIAPPFD